MSGAISGATGTKEVPDIAPLIRATSARAGWLSLVHGQVSAQFPAGRQLFFYRDAGRPTFDGPDIDHVGALRAAFRATRQERPFSVDAIVILPDHLHAVLTLPEGDADFPGRWRRIKGHFSSGLISVGIEPKRSSNGDLALWQRRFWEHTIRDENDFERHVDYIHINPVKHGLVHRVRDWPHSSFHRYVREGILPGDWGGSVNEFGENYGER